jgi:hypothetical protein
MSLRTDRRGAAALILAAALAPAAAFAQSGEAGAAIREVISRQLDAFRADDLAGAFASPGIRGTFGDPSNFGRMVAQGYPMIRRPAGHRFGGLAPEGGRLRQRVLVTDAAGVTHAADYYMVRVEGSWRIDAVRLLPAPPAGV